ncbi:hypothetical protein, partial [Streptomyces sp. SID10815]|uniref:hypothetical protein n=1 Tax=Streptomyces sp. SID10815 TaxID=2706027 RepID=UPI001942745E
MRAEESRDDADDRARALDADAEPDDWEEVGEAAAPVRPPRPHRPAPRPPQTLGVRCARCAALVPTGLAVCPGCLAP